MINRLNIGVERFIQVRGYDLVDLSGCLAVSIPRRPFHRILRAARGRYTTRKKGCTLEATCITRYRITSRPLIVDKPSPSL